MTNELNKVRIHKINDTKDKYFSKANQLCIKTYSESQRRILTQEALDNPKFHLYAAFYKEEFVAMLTLWDLTNFIFAENEAIESNYQNKVWGIIFKKFFDIFPNKTIIIEVDRPTDTVSINRIEFYKSLGYKINTYDYIQPKYSKDTQALPMYLMSHPIALSQEKYNKIIEQIYDCVYNVTKEEVIASLLEDSKNDD
jgi:hypothetical protein